ncbi:hypothetical protein BH23GEM4_BH23GEM4_10920 [soil metagenome]
MMQMPTIRSALLAFLLGCSPADGGPNFGGSSPDLCRVVSRGVALPPEVEEASGAELSARTPGVVWTHNDAGWGPELFAVAPDGSLAGKVRVAGADNEDWEDLARGPCPTGQCLHIGDIGDNGADRDEVVVYRIPEPLPGDARSAPAERFEARYPEGPRDAEGLFVLPSGEVYLVSKGDRVPVELFRFHLRPEGVATLEPVRTLSADTLPVHERITGATATPDGSHVLLRSHDSLHIYRTQNLLSDEPLVPPQRVDLRPLNEVQGEGVAIGADGEVVLTSEGKGKKTPATLARLACTFR